VEGLAQYKYTQVTDAGLFGGGLFNGLPFKKFKSKIPSAGYDNTSLGH